MAQQTIATTDSPETGRGKINANFDELYSIKKYVAIINQSSTSAPVATVLENTLGGTVVWTRSETGIYRGTLTDGFPLAKTVLPVRTYYSDAGAIGNGEQIDISVPSANYVEIQRFTISDGSASDGLSNVFINVTVYP